MNQPDRSFSLILSGREVDYIYNIIIQRPYVEVKDLVKNIENQIGAQRIPFEPPAPFVGGADPENEL
jgi:hypothetical protein